MLVKLRENIYIGDKDAFKSLDELKEKGITAVVVVADNLQPVEVEANSDIKVCKIGLRSDRINAPYIKDLACHNPKYMVQNMETVLIQSVTGLERAAYVACRVICEIENKTLYEIMAELIELIEGFEINRSYF